MAVSFLKGSVLPPRLKVHKTFRKYSATYEVMWETPGQHFKIRVGSHKGVAIQL